MRKSLNSPRVERMKERRYNQVMSGKMRKSMYSLWGESDFGLIRVIAVGGEGTVMGEELNEDCGAAGGNQLRFPEENN